MAAVLVQFVLRPFGSCPPLVDSPLGPSSGCLQLDDLVNDFSQESRFGPLRLLTEASEKVGGQGDSPHLRRPPRSLEG